MISDNYYNQEYRRFDNSATADSCDLNLAIENAHSEELLILLKRAKVTVGHFSGRQIHVQEYSGTVSFSKFSSQIEKNYNDIIKPMQIRQRHYENNSRSDFDVMPFRGKGAMLINIPYCILTFPYKIAADAFCWAVTPYPELSELEENKIAPMLTWRKQTLEQFDRLYQKSEQELEKRAVNSCKWKAIKAWDGFLNTAGSYKCHYDQDQKAFKEMVDNRKLRIILKPLENVFPATDKVVNVSIIAGDMLFEYIKRKCEA